MKAAFYLVGDINRASSRYRGHWIIPAHGDFFRGKGDNWKNVDVIVFQRVANRHGLAVEAKKAGKLIVFDLTDAYFYRHKWKKAWGDVSRMAKLAHCLTTGNNDDAHMLRTIFGKRVHVIPNAQQPSKHRRKHTNIAVPTLGVLGRENTMKKSLETIWPVLSRLSAMGVRYRLMLINDNGRTLGLTLPFTQIVGRKWNLDKIYQILANNVDVGVCTQVKQADGRYHKDENKAYTFWACGIPCVSFARTKDWYGDLHKLLTDHGHRKMCGARGPNRAKEVGPSRVAQRWHRVISEELGRLK